MSVWEFFFVKYLHFNTRHNKKENIGRVKWLFHFFPSICLLVSLKHKWLHELYLNFLLGLQNTEEFHVPSWCAKDTVFNGQHYKFPKRTYTSNVWLLFILDGKYHVCQLLPLINYRDNKHLQSTSFVHYSTPVVGKLWSVDQIGPTTALERSLLELKHPIGLCIG